MVSQFLCPCNNVRGLMAAEPTGGDVDQWR